MGSSKNTIKYIIDIDYEYQSNIHQPPQHSPKTTPANDQCACQKVFYPVNHPENQNNQNNSQRNYLLKTTKHLNQNKLINSLHLLNLDNFVKVPPPDANLTWYKKKHTCPMCFSSGCY